ncbi:MAG: hypothetical protein NC300_05870 [Bacteroidales bacterium]|nr:hypothetical protein [Clostridium sp.]MCM1203650.1 hypothetical protein [Bacteroidales bacterium]
MNEKQELTEEEKAELKKKIEIKLDEYKKSNSDIINNLLTAIINIAILHEILKDIPTDYIYSSLSATINFDGNINSEQTAKDITDNVLSLPSRYAYEQQLDAAIDEALENAPCNEESYEMEM